MAGFLFAGAVLAGCANFAPQTNALREQPPAGLPPRVELAEVPFFPQEDHYCGPAALAMVLNAQGVKTTPEQLIEQVYLPARKGSLQVEMLAAARRHGLVAYELAPETAHLLREIAGGTPVIVLENYGFSLYPVWHYSVVVGYDLDNLEVIRRSGTRQRRETPLTVFEYLWKKENHWAMVAVPPHRLPATADESSYAAAVAALESAGQTRPAHAAYRTLLERWPKSLPGIMGLGNTAHALRDFNTAESAFRKATREHPESAAAFNNLAQTLADRHRMREALAAAERAVLLGGPLLPTSRSTLEEIRRKLAARR